MNLKNNKAPIFMLFAGILGAGAAVVAVPMTVKAVHKCDAKKKELNVDKLTFKQTIKTVWPYTIAPITCLAGGIVFGILGNREYVKKIAGITSYATATATSLANLEKKLPEIVGEDKAKKVKEAAAQETINQIPANKTIIMNGGDVLFYEPITKQLFKSDITKIDGIANMMTSQCQDSINGEVTLNQMLRRLDLEESPIGDNLVWTNEKSYDKGIVKIIHHTATSRNGQPCFLLEYENLAMRSSDGHLDYDWNGTLVY